MFAGNPYYLQGVLKTFEDFKNALGQRESGNRYDIVNRYGYTGRYQFGRPRLSDLGYTGTMEAFRNSPQLQESYFIKHVADHARTLSPYLAQAQTKYGSWLTLSGLIAYAHLLGGGQAKKWAKGGADKTDGNGVYGKTYAQQFSGYTIPESNEVSSNEPSGAAYGATKIAEQLSTGAGITEFLPAVLLIGTALGIIYYYYKS